MKKIIIAGNIIVDYVKSIDRFPLEGTLTSIRDVGIYVGGAVCNTAITLKKLDKNIKVFAHGNIGNDKEGIFVYEQLRFSNIDLTGVIKSVFPTSFTDVMTTKQGERTFFHSAGANQYFDLDLDFILKVKPDLIHIGYPTLLKYLDAEDEKYGTVLARRLETLKTNKIPISIDLVSSPAEEIIKKVKPLLKYCDHLFLNEIEASYLTAVDLRDNENQLIIKHTHMALKKILTMGVKKTVVLHSPEASFLINNKENIYELGSHILPSDYIIGTVGAGDAFSAGMIYSIINDYPYEKRLEIASCTATTNLSVIDSVSGATTLERTMEAEVKFLRRKIK